MHQNKKYRLRDDHLVIGDTRFVNPAREEVQGTNDGKVPKEFE